MKIKSEIKPVLITKPLAKAIIIFCCAMLALSSAAVIYISITASSANPADTEHYTWYTADPNAATFTLKSAQEFLAFANITNGTAPEGITQTNFTDKEILLTVGISLDSYGAGYDNGGGWIPVGAFNGTFDGKGNKVVGLYVNRPLVDFQALFSRLGVNGTIKNLVVEGIRVYGRNYVAGLVGYSQGTITGCCNAVGEVKAHNALNNAHSYAGGIVALADGGGGGVYLTAATAEVCKAEMLQE